MSINLRSYIIGCVAGGLVVVLIRFAMEAASVNPLPRDELARNSGTVAAVSSVPATANPYIGTDSRLAEEWLAGWIDADELVRRHLAKQKVEGK